MGGRDPQSLGGRSRAFFLKEGGSRGDGVGGSTPPQSSAKCQTNDNFPRPLVTLLGFWVTAGPSWGHAGGGFEDVSSMEPLMGGGEGT